METNFELLDYIIFISYGLIILGVGLWVSRNKEGKEYHNFQTLWILTKINNKWGIQFRSSFLEGASQVSDIRI